MAGIYGGWSKSLGRRAAKRHGQGQARGREDTNMVFGHYGEVFQNDERVARFKQWNMESLVLKPGMTAQSISVKNGRIEANALDFQKQVNTYHESMNNVSAISPVTITLYEKLGGPQWDTITCVVENIRDSEFSEPVFLKSWTPH